MRVPSSGTLLEEKNSVESNCSPPPDSSIHLREKLPLFTRLGVSWSISYILLPPVWCLLGCQEPSRDGLGHNQCCPMIDPACFRPACLASPSKPPCFLCDLVSACALPGFCLPDFNVLSSFVFVDYKGSVYIPPRELFCGLFSSWDLLPAVFFFVIPGTNSCSIKFFFSLFEFSCCDLRLGPVNNHQWVCSIATPNSTQKKKTVVLRALQDV